ncbi:MAG: RsmE family RNA methyltransferase [Candidatus Dormibacteria bacterium]
MPVFLVPQGQVNDAGQVQILDRDAWHISRSLRRRVGQLVTVVLEPGTEHDVRLLETSPDRVLGVIVGSRQVRREPRVRLHLVQALPQGQGMASVCEQASELGVASIWPVICDRSVVRPGPDASRRRERHWQTVSREAAQLALRHAVPEVMPVQPLPQALERLGREEEALQVLVCQVGPGPIALGSPPWDRRAPTALVVGPEGGLSPAELRLLQSRGYQSVSLGPRTLRTSLAGTVALTLLLARAGEMELVDSQ